SSLRYFAALRLSFSSAAGSRDAAARTLGRLGFGAPPRRAFAGRFAPPRSFIPPSRDPIELARMLAQKTARRARRLLSCARWGHTKRGGCGPADHELLARVGGRNNPWFLLVMWM